MVIDEVKTFYLLRKQDVSGVSGTGIVAYGAVLPSGKVIMEWCSFHSTLTIFANLEDLVKIHGHGEATEVIFGKPNDYAAAKTKRGRKAKEDK